MKAKDFFKKLKADGKITKPEFDAFVETVPDFEIPETGVIDAFEDSFLTPERALSDKRVYPKIKTDVLLPVDSNIKAMLAFIDTFDKFKSSDIDKMQSTYDKQKAIHEFIPELIEKVKKTPGTDDDTKKKLKTLEETNTDLLGRIEKMNSEFSEKEKFFESQAEKKISDFEINMELENLANSFKFGKAFEDPAIRQDIKKVKLDGLRAKHALKLVTTETGQRSIQVTDKEGKPLFNGNSAVTINQLLEEEFKPYIKANNSGEDDHGDNSQSQVTKRFNVQDGKTQVRQGARTTVQ